MIKASRIRRDESWWRGCPRKEEVWECGYVAMGACWRIDCTEYRIEGIAG